MLCQELVNTECCQMESVAPGQRDGQAEGYLCPAEERTAHRSLFARRITSFSGEEESFWVKGRAQRGREPHQGQEERRERGGRRKSPTGLPETCHPGRVGQQLLHSLTLSLPPLPSACCLPAGKESQGPGVAGLLPCGDQETRKETHFPPPHSLTQWLYR